MSRRHRWILIAWLMVVTSLPRGSIEASPAASSSQPSIPLSIAAEGAVIVEPVGYIGGPIQVLTIHSSYAYVGVGRNLLVMSLADPRRPKVVGYVRLPDMVNGVTVAGGLAYVTARDGVWILDVSDPSRPRIAGRAPGGATRSAIAGNYLYVTYATVTYQDGLLFGFGGLRILDVSNPAAPRELGRYQEEMLLAGNVALAGSYAYVEDTFTHQTVVFDVSSPTSPRKIGTVNPSPNRVDMVIGNYAYGVASDWGVPPSLVIMDVRDPSAPQVIGSLSLTELSDASRMTVVGNYAYVVGITETLGSPRGSLQVADVSDPRHPRWAGSSLLPPSSEATDVAANGRYIYVTDRWIGLRTFDGNDPRNPQEITTLAFPGSATRIATDGSYLYGIGMGNKLWIFNAPNPPPPWLAGYQDLSTQGFDTEALDIAASMNRVYIAIGGRLEIIDARNPAAPTVFRPTILAWGVDAIGNQLYVANYTGLEIYDMSNLASPQRIGFLSGDMERVTVVGNYAYARSFNQLLIIDVRNPTSPRLVGRYTVPTPSNNAGLLIRDVAVDHNRAYILYPTDGGGDRLEVLDVSQPESPRRMGIYDLPRDWHAVGVEAEGAYVYLLRAKCSLSSLEPYRSTLQILDVHDPSSLRVTGSYEIPGCAEDIEKEADYIYIAKWDELMVMRIHQLDRSVYLPLVLRNR
ncbi:LVIVD repeat-containing protein [Thermoflexus sp.]|uniref:LVIVD repeat-containing protein n=1 Tax=Thermoflexus sp. TaxID=1969742 RepID=UPI0035E4110C